MAGTGQGHQLTMFYHAGCKLTTYWQTSSLSRQCSKLSFFSCLHDDNNSCKAWGVMDTILRSKFCTLHILLNKTIQCFVLINTSFYGFMEPILTLVYNIVQYWLFTIHVIIIHWNLFILNLLGTNFCVLNRQVFSLYIYINKCRRQDKNNYQKRVGGHNCVILVWKMKTQLLHISSFWNFEQSQWYFKWVVVSDEQYYGYITGGTSYIQQDDNDVHFVLDQHAATCSVGYS